MISHFAGKVEYETEGWIKKNNTLLAGGMEEFILDAARETRDPLVMSLLKLELDPPSDEDEDDKKVNAAAANTIGESYVNNLNGLVKDMEQSTIHYVRCFKPNHKKQPDMFEKDVVRTQMIHSGVGEHVRLMHQGFALRLPFQQLLDSFTSKLPADFVANLLPRDFVKALMRMLAVPKGEYHLGITRLFLRSGQMAAMKDMTQGEFFTDEKIVQIKAELRRDKVRRMVW